MSNVYADILNTSPKPSRVSEPIEELRRFCEGVTVYVGPNGQCILERGYVVNIGQEFKVSLVRTDNQYKLVLLRAYVPPKDFPVYLDSYGDEMIECTALLDLKRELGKFLSTESVQDQIREWVR